VGLWPRLGWTAAVTLALAGGCWWGLRAAGADQATAVAVAAGLAAVVVALGAVWASRAGGAEGGAGPVVSRSPSGQAVGEVHGPVFGPGSDFRGARISLARGAGALGGARRPPGPAGGGDGPVVVGEIPQEPVAFRDRPELLSALTDPPPGRRVAVVFAVTGLRGVGKSQLAAACARRRLDQGWRVVAWIAAEDREQLLAGFAQLAAALGLAEDGQDSQESAARVRHWLEADGTRCLLVLDNAGSAEVLRPFLPAAGHAQVIVTSSRQALAALGAPVPVGVFTDGQAAAYLAERTGLADEPGALQVAAELGCLPLALAQAAAVIAGQHLGYATYLQRLAAIPAAEYLTRTEEDPYPRGTAEAIILSLDAAGQHDPGGLGRRLLDVLCVLSAAGASRGLLAAAGGAAPADADAAVQQLADGSLVTWSVDGSTVAGHRLVMRVVRERAARDGTLAAAVTRAISGLQAMLPAHQDAWQHPAVMQELVQQVTALTAHLAAYPAIAAGQAEADLLTLQAWAGWYLSEVSDVSRAIPLLEQNFADRQRVLGPGHPGTLTSRNNLAAAYRAAGRLDDAIPPARADPCRPAADPQAVTRHSP
jgi:hypothetical protein